MITSVPIFVSASIGQVSGLFQQPAGATHLLVLGHGAGAGMNHAFMEKLADGLTESGIATLRYQFPYMEQGKKVPDRPVVAMATVSAAVAKARELAPELPILAGGKSFGGRMTSLLAATEALPGVKGLIFFGFPLHAPGKPGKARAAHLKDIPCPTLFLQGTRDTLADNELIGQVCADLPLATLHFIDGGDHSFKMLKRSGRTQDDAIHELVQQTREWAATKS